MAERDYCAIAARYVDDVLAARVPACKWVRLACERQRRDLKRWGKRGPYLWSPVAATRVCRFVELLPHIKGPLAGQAIALEPWQVFVITTTFGWLKRADGKRRFRRVYIEVPRGNGKSAISSALGLYMLCADGEAGADCYSFATTRDQAKIVFGDAQHMARKSPELRAHFGLEVQAHNMNILETASKFEALSAEGSTLDGLNTHFGCVDELHAHRTRFVYDVVETSTGKRDNSLLWVITTAGADRSGICYEIRSFVTKVLMRAAKDEAQFGIIYTIDEHDDWTTEAALRKANPNWGVSVRPEVVLSLQAKAMQMPSAANNFQTKHLDVWVNADVLWMDMRAWERCREPALNIESFAKRPCYIGLDLATKTDIAAKLYLFPLGDGSYAAFETFYLPEEAVQNGVNASYTGWEREGWLTVTPGNVIDLDQIEAELIADLDRFDVREIAYDPFQATQLATHLIERGAPMVELRPTVLNFSQPMKELEALVLKHRLRHRGNPAMTWMLSNVVCHMDAKDNIYPRKERAENKIDGPVAAIMALARALAGGDGKSIYEQRGLLTL